MNAKYRIDDLNTFEVKEMLLEAKVALLPVGATEQHGSNLSTGVDWRIAEQLALEVAKRSAPKAFVLPPIPYGLSQHHQDFFGTFHISSTTFRSIIHDLADSLKRQGITKLVFINGHRGNENILGVLINELTYELGVETASAFWLKQASDVIQKHVQTERWGHACEIETSIAMAATPDLVGSELQSGELTDNYIRFEDSYKPFALTTARSFRSRTNNGVFGDARGASKEIGQEIVDTFATRVAEFVLDFSERADPHGS